MKPKERGIEQIGDIRHPSPVTIRCDQCGLLATDSTAAVAARRADIRFHNGRRLCPTCRPNTPRRKAR